MVDGGMSAARHEEATLSGQNFSPPLFAFSAMTSLLRNADTVLPWS